MESIFKQGLDENDYEVIIVNDGTPDKSMEMISDIILQHNNIIVINQENQGLSVARNNGIAVAKGEYIFMPDSDDILIERRLQMLLKKVMEVSQLFKQTELFKKESTKNYLLMISIRISVLSGMLYIKGIF